jgi:hypothetical protein
MAGLWGLYGLDSSFVECFSRFAATELGGTTLFPGGGFSGADGRARFLDKSSVEDIDDTPLAIPLGRAVALFFIDASVKLVQTDCNTAVDVLGCCFLEATSFAFKAFVFLPM